MADPAIAPALESLRARHPLDPGGEHPVARVIRSGEPELQARMSEELMRSFAQGSEHARFMIDHRYHSAVVAPLLAPVRTLGALSLLRLGDSEPYTSADLDLGNELARRAALAIDNAQLFSEVRRVEQRLEAVLVNLAEERGQRCRGAGQSRHGMAGFMGGAHQLEPRIGDQGRAGIRHQCDRGAVGELAQQFRPRLLRIVIVIGCERRADHIAIEEFPRDAGILAGDEVGAGQSFQARAS